MKNNKRNKYMLLLILLLGITIGYAALSTTLKINGSATITKNNWSVYWSNIQVTPGSVDASTNIPALGADQNQPANTKVTWGTTLNLPGDFYEFTVDATNNGSIDAMITGINPTVTPALQDYIKYTVTYDDDVPIAMNQLLPKKNGNVATTQKYKVRVEFLDTITAEQVNAIPEGGFSYTFSFEVTYSQANENAIAKPIQAHFATDSWDAIIAAYKGGATKYLEEDMKNGVTREIQMDTDNDEVGDTTYHLRIANLSRPTECSQEGFSQTACGFVIEFADVFPRQRYNSADASTSTDGFYVKGGWKLSEVRAYLNNKLYAAENIDYSNNGFLNMLPGDIKSKIIDTTVVSGYGKYDSANFITTDKLYLLSTHEVWEDVSGTTNGIDDKDTAYNNTRQLDYYKSQGVTTSNYSGAIKKVGTAAGDSRDWWLRTPYAGYEYYEFFVNNYGDARSDTSGCQYTISPAFRIAE